MTVKDIEILERINKYAEEKLGDIDPQKTQVSVQLQTLMPKLKEIAEELDISLEDMFIKYMDLQSEASALNERKLRESFADLANDDQNPLLFR